MLKFPYPAAKQCNFVVKEYLSVTSKTVFAQTSGYSVWPVWGALSDHPPGEIAGDRP